MKHFHVFIFFIIILIFTSNCLELKIQLQSSFEFEDTPLEGQPADPDTPVVLAPDQLGEPADTLRAATKKENLLTVDLSSPTHIILDGNCTLSEKLRDLRIETRR